MSRWTTTPCARASRGRPCAALPTNRRWEGLVPPRADVAGRVHREVAELAQRATAGAGLRAARRHGPDLRPRREDARHVALVVEGRVRDHRLLVLVVVRL